MTAPYTLIVIDMQTGFDTAADCPDTIEACTLAIRQAIDSQADILVLEYSGNGRTLWELTQEWDEYDRVFTAIKSYDDGSEQVGQAVSDNDLSTNFKVCGVNTAFCVEGTVMGMIEQGFDCITLLENACNNPLGYESDASDEFGTDAALGRMAENGVMIDAVG